MLYINMSTILFLRLQRQTYEKKREYHNLVHIRNETDSYSYLAGQIIEKMLYICSVVIGAP